MTLQADLGPPSPRDHHVILPRPYDHPHARALVTPSTRTSSPATATRRTRTATPARSTRRTASSSSPTPGASPSAAAASAATTSRPPRSSGCSSTVDTAAGARRPHPRRAGAGRHPCGRQRVPARDRRPQPRGVRALPPLRLLPHPGVQPEPRFGSQQGVHSLALKGQDPTPFLMTGAQAFGDHSRSPPGRAHPYLAVVGYSGLSPAAETPDLSTGDGRRNDGGPPGDCVLAGRHGVGRTRNQHQCGAVGRGRVLQAGELHADVGEPGVGERDRDDAVARRARC